ncbi:hypothetical protein [Synechococcus elongatus]|uniref:hypothetical protein n=1 Tax=Synechococcus elongatus TaxID=32046 RepID=UPI000039FF07|nr:hypothetical protein [Synechococcus elongatus]MBD2588617.1 hypothetical protein [Synechococcus elongatus FACHB-242]MBD2689794.1 hypothetical protein [Synechococcus elongatus FACHB-1061]MBD2708401.1 hypothetical protein [Synechococcus elongatus PCC 7942 = FACHB-805]WKW06302.1 hypothetical protein QY054_03775 [Synechococcus elongatus PCC 7942 = FACHB-805]
MKVSVFAAGQSQADRLLVIQCADQSEAASAWGRVYELAIAFRVQIAAVRVWIQSEREYLSWFRIAEAAGELGESQPKSPKQG